MQKRARVQGGIAYIRKESHDKLTKIMFIVTLVYVSIFILVQILILILTTFYKVTPEAFLAELNTCIFFLMLFVNIYALVNYCRNAGSPYMNEKNRKYVRKFKVSVVVWNLAFIMKFLFTTLGSTILDI